jgi:polyphosphate glucokinase
MEFRGEAAELSTAARLVEDDEMSLKRWAKRVNRYLLLIHRVFSPQRIIMGGGISKQFEQFATWLDVGCEIVPAELRNQAGIVGAAVAASLGKDRP